MPKVMKTGGINLSEDVVKIVDLAPSYAVRPKTKSQPRPAAIPDGQVPDDGLEVGLQDGEDLGGEAFEAEDFGGGAPLDMTEDASVPLQMGGISEGGIKGEIVQAAMAEAGRILEDAVRKAEQARDEELAKVQAEADEMRRRAAEEGRQEGLAAAVQDAEEATTQLEAAIARFEADRAGFEVEYEGQLKWLAMEIAEKVLAKKVAADDAEMLEMVEKAVQSVKSEPWIRVEVAQEMTGLIDRLTAAFEAQEHIEVSAVPAPAGTVQIETPSGVVDASLKTQLANLREYFAASQQ